MKEPDAIMVSTEAAAPYFSMPEMLSLWQN